jgi:pimeloyl-ACP methyl ester carboxylesterase
MYDYAVQVARLEELLDRLGLVRVHLAGSSMGGTIAALFAMQHPDRVASVAFIGAPHGIRSLRPSVMDRLIDAGERPLIARDKAEFERMLALIFEQRPFLPYPILHAAQRRAIDNAQSNRRLWGEQLNDRYLLDERVLALKARTLALGRRGPGVRRFGR